MDPLDRLLAGMGCRNAPAEPGDVFAGRYHVEERIGNGSFGEVYRVRDNTLGRPLALKVLFRNYLGCEHQDSFEREGRRLANLRHPHILPVFDVGRLDDGRPFFTTVLLPADGRLSDRLRESPPAERFADWRRDRLTDFLRVCEGLAHAHAAGVAHGDLAPRNAMASEHGEFYVIDFGLASDDATDADRQRDVSALGDILHQTLDACRSAGWPTPPRPLADLVTDCRQSDPTKRPTAAAVAERVWAHFAEEQERPRRRLRRTAVVAVVAALAVAVWFALYFADAERREKDRSGQLEKSNQEIAAKVVVIDGQKSEIEGRKKDVEGALREANASKRNRYLDTADAEQASGRTVESLTWLAAALPLAEESEDRPLIRQQMWNHLRRLPLMIDTRPTPEPIRFNGVSLPDRKWHYAAFGTSLEVRDAAGGQVKAVLPHPTAVEGVEFLPTGDRLLTIDEGRTVRVWQLTAAKPLVAELPPADPLTGRRAHFLDPHRLILFDQSSWQQAVLRVWDVRAKKGLSVEVKGQFRGLAVSPEGNAVATAVGNRVTLWDADTLKPRPDAVGWEQKEPSKLAFSRNGKWLAVGGGDNTVEVHDVSTGRLLLRTPPQEREGIAGVRFSLGAEALVVTFASGASDVYSTANWRLLPRDNPPPRLLTADGDLLGPDLHTRWVGFRSGLNRVDVAGEQRGTVLSHTSPVRQVAVDPSGRHLATLQETGTLQVFDLQTGDRVNQWAESGVLGVAFSPDGNTLAVTGGAVAFVSPDLREQRYEVEKDFHTSGGVSWSSDGKRLAVIDNYTSVAWVVDVTAAAGPKRRKKLAERAMLVEFRPGTHQLLVGTTDRGCELWDADSAKQVRQLRLSPVSQLPPDATNITAGQKVMPKLAPLFSGDGKRLASTSDGRLEAVVFDAESGDKLLPAPGQSVQSGGVAVSPDGRFAVTYFPGADPVLWDVPAGTGTAFASGHTGDVRFAEFSPDGRLLVTIGSDRRAVVQHVASGRVVANLSDFAHPPVWCGFLPPEVTDKDRPEDPKPDRLALAFAGDLTVRLFDLHDAGWTDADLIALAECLTGQSARSGRIDPLTPADATAGWERLGGRYRAALPVPETQRAVEHLYQSTLAGFASDNAAAAAHLELLTRVPSMSADPVVWIERGRCRANLLRYADAEADFRHALALATPKDKPPHPLATTAAEWVGWVLGQQGRDADALAAYPPVPDRPPAGSRLDLAVCHLNRGDCYARLAVTDPKRWPDAADHFARCLRVLTDRGRHQGKAGNISEADVWRRLAVARLAAGDAAGYDAARRWMLARVTGEPGGARLTAQEDRNQAADLTRAFTLDRLPRAIDPELLGVAGGTAGANANTFLAGLITRFSGSASSAPPDGTTVAAAMWASESFQTADQEIERVWRATQPDKRGPREWAVRAVILHERFRDADARAALAEAKRQTDALRKAWAGGVNRPYWLTLAEAQHLVRVAERDLARPPLAVRQPPDVPLPDLKARIAAAEKQVTANPADADARLALALNLLQLGTRQPADAAWDKAADHLRAVVKARPDDRTARHYLALALLRQDKQAEYEQLCGEALDRFRADSSVAIRVDVIRLLCLRRNATLDTQAYGRIAGGDSTSFDQFTNVIALLRYPNLTGETASKLLPLVDTTLSGWVEKDPGRDPATFLLLSLSNHLQGKPGEPERRLKEAEAATDDITAGRRSLPWHRRLENDVLLAEVRALVRPAKK